jgi:lipoprotein-releasing system ATP-binding protein
MADNILNASGVAKFYGEAIKTQILFGVDLKVERGSFTAIIGPSGSGKSTLLNLLSFLEKPTAGDILIDDVSLAGMPSDSIARFRNTAMGFVFQFHYLLPEFTALENVLIPVWIRSGNAAPEMRQKALEIMRRIGMDKSVDKYPAQMSGGQQQRAAIARALINDPKIIFADEPTGNLDHETGESVLKLMKELIRERGMTLVMVTHDRDIALKADHIVELVDGKVCRAIDLSKVNEKTAREMLVERACRLES